MDLNRAMLIGNLTRDPEIRTTQSGQNVATFGIATNHSWTDPTGQRQEKAEFHNIVAWGKLAEICSQFLTKGRKVYVEGRIQTREWEGQDGVKRQRTEVVAENVIMLDRAPAGASQFSRRAAASAPPAPSTPSAPSPASGGIPPFISSDEDKGRGTPSAPSTDEIRVEDIPF